MSRFCNVWQKVEGCVEHNDVEINYTITWVKDLVSGNTDIDSIDEVSITKDNGNGVWEEDSEYYLDHKEEIKTAIYSDAYAKGEPEFEDECNVSYSQIKEAFAEQEKEDL